MRRATLTCSRRLPAARRSFRPTSRRSDVAATAKSGYTIDVNDSADADNRNVLPAADTCNTSAAASRAMYHVEALPVAAGQTGTRRFASDHRGTIYFSNTAALSNPITETTFIN